jgi:NAD(P)H-dependent FMN reductase
MELLPLYIPVILGTTRIGRMSAHVARLLTDEVSKQAGVETDLIDIAGLPLPTNDAGEAIKEGAFSSKMDRADGLVIVAPEYNHGYSGLLKHVLDSCLKEYIQPSGSLEFRLDPLAALGSSKTFCLSCENLDWSRSFGM